MMVILEWVVVEHSIVKELETHETPDGKAFPIRPPDPKSECAE